MKNVIKEFFISFDLNLLSVLFVVKYLVYMHKFLSRNNLIII